LPEKKAIQTVAPNAVLSSDANGLDADPKRHDVGLVVIGELPYAEMMGDIRVEGLSKGKKTNMDPSTKSEEAQMVPFHDGTSRSHMEYAALPIMEKGPYGTHLYLHELHPEDIATIQNITNKGIPVVAIMICGRPLVISRELEASKAFVVAWLPGSEGQGVTDVIFGDYNFQGKLSFSRTGILEMKTIIHCFPTVMD
jgi:beta-glucosidase